MSDIRWEDPPPERKLTGWAAELVPLMDHPKRWAVIDIKRNTNLAATIAAKLRRGTLTRPPGRWEFTSRTVDDEHRVYARYLGPDEEAGS